LWTKNGKEYVMRAFGKKSASQASQAEAFLKPIHRNEFEDNLHAENFA
jgi:hypothetical protein